MKDMCAILEFDRIKEMLKDCAVTDHGKEKLLALSPILDEGRLKMALKDTGEARLILDTLGNPPLPGMKDLKSLLLVAEKGGMLLPAQLENLRIFIASCRKLMAYLKKAEITGASIAYYGASMDFLDFLYEEIDRSIQGQQVANEASKVLAQLRRKMENASTRIKTHLEELLKKKKAYCSDGFISQRNGHFTLPIKKEYKHQVSGLVIATSSTGATCFIEPSSVLRLKEELSALESAASEEENKILYALTALVDDCRPLLLQNAQAVEALDFLFAKGKLSATMKGICPQVNTARRFTLVGGRHPLLQQSQCVPLDFSFGEGIEGIIITGPNTGGKTVALKTVGLFSLMAQSGLHLPCDQADICLHNAVLCDIGDGQSITENLSTFSAHLTNILDILGSATADSLVLLDELGSGTDPAEGMGIAVAVLEELGKKGCLFLATTHYPEIKEYAHHTPGLTNARMTFDRENLRPLYQLEIGEAGESCALYIAKRLGLPRHMLERAAAEAYRQGAPDRTPRDAPSTQVLLENSQEELQTQATPPKLSQEQNRPPVNAKALKFRVGDCVVVHPERKLGIVCQTANEKGELGVQIQKVKKMVGYKRLQLKAPADQMYPEDYDFSIVFDSVENRKNRKKMAKKHVPGLEIPSN